MSRRERYLADPEIDVVTGVCPHDCPDTCAWQVAVRRDDRRAVDIWGHPDQPLTRGGLCTKVDRYLDRTYHPDRLQTPLRRHGPKGSGEFVPISWDEAITEVAARLGRVIEDHGAESVMQYSYAGTMGLLQGEGVDQRLWNALGVSRLARTICAEAGSVGYRYTIGRSAGVDPLDLEHAELVLIWGSNTLTSNLHLWPVLLRARKRGAKIVVIDPARTRTARAADDWIAIRPGTDAALALAMMHVLIRDDLVDHDFIARGTVGFEALAERVEAWTPARAAEITGVPAARIEALAKAYGAASPAAIRVNYGLQRHRGGGMAVRSIACLPALVGAWRHRGGGCLLSTSGAFETDKRTLARPDLLEGRAPRTFNMVRLGDALSLDSVVRARALHHPRPADPTPTAADAGAAVHALVVYDSNPLAVCPDQNAVRRGLEREDLFTVVLEHFQTDTADYADLVLPATTQLEHFDVHGAYGHLYVSLNRPAIAPVGASLPNSEIFRRIARAMGRTEPCFSQDDEAILRELVEAQRAPAWAGVTWARLEAEGFVRLDVPSPYLPYADGVFPTPSGKCELFSSRMAEDGYDPLPAYTPPAALDEYEDARQDGRDGGTLLCISPPAHGFLNSTFVNVERLARREGRPRVTLHPHDAAARAVSDGDAVTVANDYGALELEARVSEDIVQGTVLVPGVWWAKLSPGGQNINAVTSQAETDFGGGATFYDTRVQVRPV